MRATSATLHLHGVVLPDDRPRDLWLDGDRVRLDPVPGATTETVSSEGWLLPGLVDVHTHPGAHGPGAPLDAELLRDHLGAQRDAGVTLLRVPGSAARLPAWVHHDPALPRVQAAGPWLATPGRFFSDWGRHLDEAELATAAVEEARAGQGWCKVIGDWSHDDPPVPATVLAAVVQAVHAVGGRVAVHCQTAAGCRAAVEAGVDSLEHGMHLDTGLLDRMAAQGTALVPTMVAFAGIVGEVRARPASPRRDWFVSGWDTLGPVVAAAHEAGVLVLAGTDSVGDVGPRFGAVAEEVAWLVRAGLPPTAAVAAASWAARDWLGLPELVDGAPADIVAFDLDPRSHPGVLGSPSRVILRGQVVR
jgi:imidazolonepropionase-like amidohydrolase